MHYDFDSERGCLTLTVSKGRVVRGEELTISYGTGRTPEMLFRSYGFVCNCGSCAGLDREEVAGACSDSW